ncbi:hypothetical protein GQ44DRAFT_821713 [Phaeosphaeriaceae sp. PMI808]|nr:hypothetical protein GQ44DRAFT_821713 [Phaeosphaeriaceae sp. PMI808]
MQSILNSKHSHGGGHGLSALPETLQEEQVANSLSPKAVPSMSPFEQQNGHQDDSLPEAAQGLQLQDSLPEAIITPGEAHAEILRRLGKAEKTDKALKRRGSNESLSSLISYSIRRPNITRRPESGYSLDALAAVLEDVAQEGNLTLVEAVMALGANPNFRSVNRLKNRRHNALNKATAAGHVNVIDYLLRQGAIYTISESQRKNTYSAIHHKLLDVMYSGYGEVARYLISSHGANPFIEQRPREYFDSNRTVYRKVNPAKVFQKTVLDAIARMGNADQDMSLLKIIMDNPAFNPTSISTRIYEDKPYSGDNSRMSQTTYHYSVLSTFVKAGWADAVETLLSINPSPSSYEKATSQLSSKAKFPAKNHQQFIYPANMLTKDTWLYKPQDALRIPKLLIETNFTMTTAQRTADDSAPRTPLRRNHIAPQRTPRISPSRNLIPPPLDTRRGTRIQSTTLGRSNRPRKPIRRTNDPTPRCTPVRSSLFVSERLSFRRGTWWRDGDGVAQGYACSCAGVTSRRAGDGDSEV